MSRRSAFRRRFALWWWWKRRHRGGAVPDGAILDSDGEAWTYTGNDDYIILA